MIRCHHLLLPWLSLYLIYILFALGLLIYTIVLLFHVWFKILISLIVSPLLVISIIFWLTVLELCCGIRQETRSRKHNHLPNVINPCPGLLPRWCELLKI